MARIGPRRCQNAKCAQLIRQSGTGGRPRKFCSKACRDAAAETRYVERNGRRRNHNRTGRPRKPSIAGRTTEMVNSIYDLEAQVLAGVEDVLPPASGSPFGPLIAWLRSSQDRREATPEATDTVRPPTVDPEPAAGSPEWFNRHRLY